MTLFCFLKPMAHDTHRLLRWATQTNWAMEPAAAEQCYGILARSISDPAAAAAIAEHRAVLLGSGQPLAERSAAIVRDGVAVIPVAGPIFRYADMFSAISGGATITSLAADLTLAMRHPAVSAVVLHVDSPGGEITGVAELARHIAAYRRQKPLIAYGEGMVCSAAYWLAAACDSIAIGETAIVGSIGVVQVVAQGRGAIEIVSSQSPDKRLDATTESGRAKMQATVDALADVFVADVARYRGVSPDTVLADFGRGGVVVGQAAVAAGLADQIDTLEGVIARLGQPGPYRPAHTPFKGHTMSETTLEALLQQPPAAIDAQAFAALQQQNSDLAARIKAMEDERREREASQRRDAIRAAAESYISAGRFDPANRANLETVIGATYGTEQYAALTALLDTVPAKAEGPQVATSVPLDKAPTDDGAREAAQVAAYNKHTGVK